MTAEEIFSFLIGNTSSLGFKYLSIFYTILRHLSNFLTSAWDFESKLGVIILAGEGTLAVHVFVSSARLPVPDAVVIVSAPGVEGKQRLISLQVTDRNGRIPFVTLRAPEPSASLDPGGSGEAFSTYTLLVEHPDYQLALYEQLQIFPGIETVQEVPLVPLAIDGKDKADVVMVTPQPL